MKEPKKHIPIFTVASDLVYNESFRLPRFHHGLFQLILENLYE